MSRRGEEQSGGGVSRLIFLFSPHFLVFTNVSPKALHMVSVNQPPPPFQADRP